MTRHRILVIEDETDVRKVIELTLSRDPELAVHACASGRDGLAEAACWSPDLILLDVMMPGMDGPTTLARLREDAATTRIPVVFLTARARPAELAHFMALGACGAIAKPFAPKELRATIKGYLQAPAAAPDAPGEGAAEASIGGGDAEPLMSQAELRAERSEYLGRLQGTIATLLGLRATLRSEPASPAVLDELRTVAHRTAGSAGLYGFGHVSVAAAQLEDSIIARRAGMDHSGRVDTDIDALLCTIGREPASP